MPNTDLRPEMSRLPPESPQTESTDTDPVEADERAYRELAAVKDEVLHAETTLPVHASATSTIGAQTAAAPQERKDDVVVEVEHVLEDGIGTFYASLPADAKPMFKQKGEEAASEISNMIRTLHVKTKRVIQLITTWLKTIPGVNQFFLEQEAKIKTDRILELAETHKNDQHP
jgi:cell division septum initiation protein DivIVA